jgi:hypothetical protein
MAKAKKGENRPLEPFERVDPARLDEAVLAILYYNESVAGGAWKSLPWDATDRLFEKGLIGDPAKARKSVALTLEGSRQAEAAFERLFAGAKVGAPG